MANIPFLGKVLERVVVGQLQSPWLWSTRQCWIGYPNQPLTPELHYYYIVELSFYWSLMFSQFIDIKRKDFGIMFTHHIITIMLLTISYTVNFTRVGSLTLCLHDVVDAVLEAAKMANYCKFQRLCDFFFLVFAIVFIITRLGIYPLWILNTVLLEMPEIVGSFPALSIFAILLLTLQVLHCFWSYLIVKATYKAIVKGKARDDRSDVESSSDEEPSTPVSKNSHSSATTNGMSGANGTNGYLTSGNSAEEH
ncbi:Ceramide synthase 6 [Varanus komodoensis]|nr:Ceramide synthase 6 [Varanus komodoensis]